MPLSQNAEQRLEEALLKAHRLFKLYFAILKSQQFSTALRTFSAAESLIVSKIIDESVKTLPAEQLLKTVDTLYKEQYAQLNTLYIPVLKYYNTLIDKLNLGQYWKFPPFIKIRSCQEFSGLLSSKLQALDKQYELSQQEYRGGLSLSKKTSDFWQLWVTIAYMTELTNTFGNQLPKVLGSSTPSSTRMMLQQLNANNTEKSVVNKKLEMEMERKSIFEAKPKLERAPQALNPTP